MVNFGSANKKKQILEWREHYIQYDVLIAALERCRDAMYRRVEETAAGHSDPLLSDGAAPSIHPWEPVGTPVGGPN